MGSYASILKLNYEGQRQEKRDINITTLIQMRNNGGIKLGDNGGGRDLWSNS